MTALDYVFDELRRCKALSGSCEHLAMLQRAATARKGIARHARIWFKDGWLRRLTDAAQTDACILQDAKRGAFRNAGR